LPGIQKNGSAGTAGTGQTTFCWTKWDLDEKVIGQNIARAKKSCLVRQIQHLDFNQVI
jgi:hypothetical protein